MLSPWGRLLGFRLKGLKGGEGQLEKLTLFYICMELFFSFHTNLFKNFKSSNLFIYVYVYYIYMYVDK